MNLRVLDRGAAMSDATTDQEITFTIRALDDAGGSDGKPVPADVFARKMQEILDALKEADRSVNSGVRHEFVITDLKKGSAEVTFAERPLPAFADVPVASSTVALNDCIGAIYRDDIASARRYDGVVQRVLRMSSGAGDKYAFIEVSKSRAVPYRADRSFHDQALRISEELKITTEKRVPKLFRGSVTEGFDGSILEVDLRSKVRRCKLVLSDGTKEIDCDFVDFTTDEIREVLDCRVWAEGIAIYNGESGLPVRFEIRTVRPIKPQGDITKWRGAVEVRDGNDWFD